MASPYSHPLPQPSFRASFSACLVIRVSLSNFVRPRATRGFGWCNVAGWYEVPQKTFAVSLLLLTAQKFACARFDRPGVEDTGALYLRTSVVSRNVVRWYRYIHVVAGLETSVSRVNLEIDIAWFSGGPYRISAPPNSIRGRVTSTSSLFAA